MGSLYPQIPVPGAKSIRPATYGKELVFDFVAGEFVMEDGRPKVVEGKEALKIWIEKTIRTARYRFPVYTFAYGCELEDIIGLDIPSPVLESEMKRVIREALIYDDRIKDVRDFKFSRGGDWLKVEFLVVDFMGESWSQGVSYSV